MATTLSQDQVKVLEQTRQRLVQLTHSLGSLAASLQQSDPLPPWTSLQSQASIISNNLVSISEQLSENRELLSSLVAYPAPSFPGRTHAGALQELLRTKLDPRVEDWVAQGRTSGASALEDKKKNGLSEQELAELWEWAPIGANVEARRRIWGGNFTLEEKEMGIQNVVTGLTRQPEDDDSEADEDGEEAVDEDDEMEVMGAHRKAGGVGVELSRPASGAVPLDEIFRYMMTGVWPKSGNA